MRAIKIPVIKVATETKPWSAIAIIKLRRMLRVFALVFAVLSKCFGWIFLSEEEDTVLVRLVGNRMHERNGDRFFGKSLPSHTIA